MKVSVHMVTYNHEKFIAQAIESILMQKVDFEYEIVIGEDCSTDNTRQIVIDYQKKYPNIIRLLLPVSNIGAHANAISTYKACNGQYIALLEGDDYWLSPDKLQKQVNFLDGNSDFAICFTNALIFREDNHANSTIFLQGQAQVSTIENLLTSNFISTPSVMYRNKLIREFPAWFTEQSMGDWTSYILLAEHGKIGYIDEVMSAYRVHAGGTWSSKRREHQLTETIKMLQSVRKYFAGKNKSEYQNILSDSIAYYSRQLPHQESSLDPLKLYPLVSVCIPTYNGEKFVAEAIQSVLAQSYPNLEIILSDDNSSDRTIEIAKSFQAQSPHKFSILEHSQYGLAENWNFCIAQATGKYLKFIFQDDLLEPEAIESMVALAEQDPEIGMVFSPRKLFTITGNIHDTRLLANHEAKNVHKGWSNLKSIQSGQELLQDLNILNNPINKIGEPSTVLIKKEVFDALGAFDQELCQLVDLEMWLRIMSQYKIGFIDRTLSSFRIHAAQQTQKNSGTKDTIFLDYQRFFEKIWSNPHYPQPTRQEALYKYESMSGSNKFSKSRRQLAEYCLNLSDEQLVSFDQSLSGRIQRTLSKSSSQYTITAPAEQIFVDNLITDLAQGLDQPQGIQKLLATMLYLRADQLPLKCDLLSIPAWLMTDYLKFIFSTKFYFQQPEEADCYYQYLSTWLDYIHTSVFENHTNHFWHNIANHFAQFTNLLPVYFNDHNLKGLQVKRAEIIEFSLKNNGFVIDHEFEQPIANIKKIRLGILSSHYTPSAETFAALPIYEYLSREFEVILYSFHESNHPLEEYCRSCANHYKLLPQELKAQVNTIRADDLDLLFVVNNVTLEPSQICLLATHRLARIQITSGGSVVTTGLKSIDYFISGEFTDPSSIAQEQYQEKLIKLPGAAHCFSYGNDQATATIKVERASLGIAPETIVFTSAANFFKIVPELFHAWAKIIAQVPNSILMLLPYGPNWSKNYPKKDFENYLIQVFAQYKIPADRLLVLDPQPVPNRADIKEYYKIADICLDSTPLSGTTSLIEPLQVGLPIIARQGNCFRSAMGAAMIQELNIYDLVADSVESYIQLAINLGNNPQLRQQKSQEIMVKMQNNPSFLDSRAYSVKIGDLFIDLFTKYTNNSQNESLQLRDLNLMVFPDWNQAEDTVGAELQQVIQTLATQPNAQNTTLLIDTTNIAIEDAQMFLSSIVMNIMMEEDLDITEELGISLIEDLQNIQWENLLPHINARIIMECDDQQTVEYLLPEQLAQRQLESFVLS
jgi:predicted O-linked N-acetylglucosamine transferase (SPINDLY family)/glycosyltransferase involved in cell wall biosynthesis